jgi:hypothetical protein
LDIHQKVSAWLHIAASIFALLAIGLISAFFGAVMYVFGAPPEVQTAFLAFGGIFAILVVATALFELFAAVACLNKWPIGRPMVYVASALQLLNVPIGTALGVYTFWAYLRESAPTVASARRLSDA